jgi:asparagine synthase (glutamine-hydrolysing)
MGLSSDGDPVESPIYEAVTAPYRRCPSANAVQRAEYADLKVYLPNGPLVKVDRMSMAHGLEVRCPLLDRRVVELAFRIPAEQKHAGAQGKTLLRRLAERRLPPGLSSLPKRGFTAPIAEWIRNAEMPRFEDEVLTSRSAISRHLDVSYLRTRFAEHGTGRDRGYELWAVWVLERWLRQVGAAANIADERPSTMLAGA